MDFGLAWCPSNPACVVSGLNGPCPGHIQGVYLYFAPWRAPADLVGLALETQKFIS